MLRAGRPACLVLACCALFSADAVRVSGQAPPPPEMKRWIMMDVGPIPAPSACGAVTRPFSVTPPRPGYGYDSGLAASDSDAPMTPGGSHLQAERDAEERARLPRLVEQGLAGNYNESLAVAWLISAGTAVERDEKQATAWFLLAAQQGHHDAFVPVGHRYFRGLGVEPSDSAAAFWFNRAASNGDRTAMSALGGLYAAGRGVPQDWPTAVRWWKEARNWRFLGDAYACGLGVEQNAEQAAAAYAKGVADGDMASSIQLGHLYASASVASPSVDAAFKAYQRAADQGYPEAQIALSQLYLDGAGVEPSPYQAYFWARLAELRLPAGDLQSLARSRAERAAKSLPPVLLSDADRFVKGVIATGSEPMHR